MAKSSHALLRLLLNTASASFVAPLLLRGHPNVQTCVSLSDVQRLVVSCRGRFICCIGRTHLGFMCPSHKPDQFKIQNEKQLI